MRGASDTHRSCRGPAIEFRIIAFDAGLRDACASLPPTTSTWPGHGSQVAVCRARAAPMGAAFVHALVAGAYRAASASQPSGPMPPVTSTSPFSNRVAECIFARCERAGECPVILGRIVALSVDDKRAPRSSHTRPRSTHLRWSAAWRCGRRSTSSSAPQVSSEILPPFPYSIVVGLRSLSLPPLRRRKLVPH